ncbi:low molecular weight protein-tyrosine-phosphatase [Alkalitalea saponilacus]|uniref:Protein-tyrosine phosphatase n=1 Tax=Alkalitalea saponilacus TaxID=889453 RepID=A0A1T5FA27_9BACT|nr:low molecular weight protein-tyrosine-phosphatase [Alkalitalea saponilacus]SKB92986.1 protein-tyrosine phosphatase [Alkalitalea saponilacus]
MMDKTKILFVCLGNICRSPSAEAVMKNLVEKHGVAEKYEIDSSGIISFHHGKPADARMRKHAERRGYNLTSISRPINPSRDFSYFDLIVGMDNQNIRDLKNLAPDKDSAQKIVKMTDFCSGGKHTEVPDPYYGGAEGFELVLDILEDACNGLLLHISDMR